jgi:hypothetical protein
MLQRMISGRLLARGSKALTISSRGHWDVRDLEARHNRLEARQRLKTSGMFTRFAKISGARPVPITGSGYLQSEPPLDSDPTARSTSHETPTRSMGELRFDLI